MPGIAGRPIGSDIRTGLDIARSTAGNLLSNSKFGRAPNGVQTTVTDLWDRADAVPTQSLWVPPTQARIHQIVSTDSGDTAAGVGARTLCVSGLIDWNLPEISETIVMNGLTDVPTVSAYVIVHRLQVLTKGATSVNIGVITATADVDGTVTAQINANKGQTQMAIYGVSSIQDAFVGLVYLSMLRAGGPAVSVDADLCINSEPQTQITNFVTQATYGVSRDGNSAFVRPYHIPLFLPGPTIIKMQAVATTVDTDVIGGFDVVLDRKRT